MLVDDLERLLLLRMGERTQGMGESDGDLAGLQELLAQGAEPFGQSQSTVDPVRLAPADHGDGLRAQLVLCAQRLHHPHFVHRRRGSRRLVRPQQQDLPLLGRPGRLYHGRHLGPSLTLPALQSLEPVQDLVGPVWIGRDTQRHVCHRDLHPRASRTAAAQST